MKNKIIYIGLIFLIFIGMSGITFAETCPAFTVCTDSIQELCEYYGYHWLNDQCCGNDPNEYYFKGVCIDETTGCADFTNCADNVEVICEDYGHTWIVDYCCGDDTNETYSGGVCIDPEDTLDNQIPTDETDDTDTTIYVYCGDGVCNVGESCSNCPADCGACITDDSDATITYTDDTADTTTDTDDISSDTTVSADATTPEGGEGISTTVYYVIIVALLAGGVAAYFIFIKKVPEQKYDNESYNYY